MAGKDRWWDHEEDEAPATDAEDSKKSVEEMLDEAEEERIRREKELAEAEHEYELAELRKKTSDLLPEGGAVGASTANPFNDPPDIAEVRIVMRNGRFYTRGWINQVSVNFVIDTGATSVHMSEEHREQIGIAKGPRMAYSTAGGKIWGHDISVDEVKIGQIVVRNLAGGSSSDGMHQKDYVLLGMSFLKHIDVDIDDGVMTLTQTSEDRGFQERKQVGPWSRGKGPQNEDGVLGLWWLSKGEAAAIGMAAMITIFCFGMGAVVLAGETVYDTTSGVVLEGTKWFEEVYEYESCLYDEYYDEYYDCYWEYEYKCSADVKYFFDVNGTEFRSQDGLFLGTWDDPCRDYVENVDLPVGSAVTVWYDPDDPDDSMLEPPSDGGWVLFFCCGPFFLLILVITMVNARFSNGPKWSFESSGLHFSSGGGHHGGHHGRYWGPRWGPRFRFRGGSRRVRTSRRRSSGRGRRSSGRRRRR